MHGDLTIEEQRPWWNDWNRTQRSGEPGTLMLRQADAAREVAQRINPRRILDVGCGTGWLGAELLPFGRVVGVDLSDEAIAAGRLRFPGVDLRSGDFATMPLEVGFDLIVTADTLAHVADQESFVRRCAELLSPGGTLLVMTQNKSVWERSSYCSPKGEGQIRNWTTEADLRGLLRSFEIVSLRTIEPGGDMGALWPVRRLVNRYTRRIPGWGGVVRALEWMGTGREFVVEARRGPQ